MKNAVTLRERKAFYTPAEVAELARVDPKTVMNWIHEGQLDAVRLSPRIYRIPLGAVIKLLYPRQVRKARVRRRYGVVPPPGEKAELEASGRCARVRPRAGVLTAHAFAQRRFHARGRVDCSGLHALREGTPRQLP